MEQHRTDRHREHFDGTENERSRLGICVEEMSQFGLDVWERDERGKLR